MSRAYRILITAFWLFGASLWPLQASAQTAVDLELALGIDVSRSIDAGEARLQRQGDINAFRNPELIEAIETGILGRIAVGYYEWAGFGHADIIVDWRAINGAASANAFVDALQQNFPLSASRTSISGAIEFAQP